MENDLNEQNNKNNQNEEHNIEEKQELLSENKIDQVLIDEESCVECEESKAIVLCKQCQGDPKKFLSIIISLKKKKEKRKKKKKKLTKKKNFF